MLLSGEFLGRNIVDASAPGGIEPLSETARCPALAITNALRMRGWHRHRIEYAMGLGYEISRQDPNIAADDLLYEVRTTLNRVSTAAVALYR